MSRHRVSRIASEVCCRISSFSWELLGLDEYREPLDVQPSVGSLANFCKQADYFRLAPVITETGRSSPPGAYSMRPLPRE